MFEGWKHCRMSQYIVEPWNSKSLFSPWIIKVMWRIRVLKRMFGEASAEKPYLRRYQLVNQAENGSFRHSHGTSSWRNRRNSASKILHFRDWQGRLRNDRDCLKYYRHHKNQTPVDLQQIHLTMTHSLKQEWWRESNLWRGGYQCCIVNGH